jgi:hypothetical protein
MVGKIGNEAVGGGDAARPFAAAGVSGDQIRQLGYLPIGKKVVAVRGTLRHVQTG